MFQQIKAEIDQMIGRMADITLAVGYLAEQRIYLEGLLNGARQALADAKVKKGKKAKTSDPAELEELKKSAAEILVAQARVALEESQEFNLAAYARRLEAACRDPRTIELLVENGGLVVKIDLDATAGNIQDYLQAVKNTRDEMKVGRTAESFGGAGAKDETKSKKKKKKKKRRLRRGPSMASFLWMEKYYKPAREGTRPTIPRTERQEGRKPRSDMLSDQDRIARMVSKYFETMEKRLDKFSGLAPFWSLVNDGVVAVKGSGHGGKPYPKIKRTNFVNKAKAEILKMYRNAMTSVPKDAPETEENVSELKRRIADLEKAIKYINEKETMLLQGDLRTNIRAALEKQVGPVIAHANPERIEELITLIEEGKATQSRYRVGGEVRARIKEIERRIAPIRALLRRKGG